MNIHFVSILTVLLLFVENSMAQNWTLAKDKEGVKIHTRKIDGWGIKEYKATTTIKGSLSKIIATLKNVNARPDWVHNTLEAIDLERPSAEVLWMYNRIDAPWPVSDRDNIIEFTFSYPSDNTARIDMRVIQSHKKAPSYSGVVRIKKLKGHWTFKDKGNGYVEVKEQLVADPGGSLPDWVVNWGVVDVPHKSMTNFKKYIESN